MDYEKIINLCNEKHITVSKLEEILGLGNCTIKKWKDGGRATVENAGKVADYFGVSIDYLRKKEQQDSAPANNFNDLISIVTEIKSESEARVNI